MKKFKVSPHAAIVSVETLTTKFARLSQSIWENGLTPNFQYAIIAGTYGIKAGVNPQTKQSVEYPTIRAIKIGTKSNKVSGLSELSINSLKRTINVDDTTVDVIDFSSILPNSAELNALQILETLSATEKLFAVVPNGTVLASTNFDSACRPRQLYKVIELSDANTVTSIVNAAKDAGLIVDIAEEPEEADTTE